MNTKNIIGAVLEIYLLYTVFSVNSLAREGKRVYNTLRKGNIETARKELSYLVSRDTEKMDEKMIIRSTMETVSENIVDGITAPCSTCFLADFLLLWLIKQ